MESNPVERPVSRQNNASTAKDLSIACRKQQWEKAKTLILTGAPINEPYGPKQFCAVHYAASENNLAFCTFLVDQKCDLKVQTNDGLTPLHFAVGNKNVSLVKLFIEAGADYELQSKKGKRPFEQCSWVNIFFPVMIIPQHNVLSELTLRNFTLQKKVLKIEIEKDKNVIDQQSIQRKIFESASTYYPKEVTYANEKVVLKELQCDYNQLRRDILSFKNQFKSSLKTKNHLISETTRLNAISIDLEQKISHNEGAIKNTQDQIKEVIDSTSKIKHRISVRCETLDCIRMFADNEVIMDSSFTIISRLIQNTTSCRKLLENGLSSVVISAMLKMTSNFSIQHKGCVIIAGTITNYEKWTEDSCIILKAILEPIHSFLSHEYFKDYFEHALRAVTVVFATCLQEESTREDFDEYVRNMKHQIKEYTLLWESKLEIENMEVLEAVIGDLKV